MMFLLGVVVGLVLVQFYPPSAQFGVALLGMLREAVKRFNSKA